MTILINAGIGLGFALLVVLLIAGTHCMMVSAYPSHGTEREAKIGTILLYVILGIFLYLIGAVVSSGLLHREPRLW